jgi:hypothetical protein
LIKVVAAAALLLCSAGAVQAQDAGGCGRYAWDIGPDQAALSGAPLPEAAAGSERAADGTGFSLPLRPWSEGLLPDPPERAPRNAASRAGHIAFAPPAEPGLYRITVSASAWIDVRQGGEYVKPQAVGGARDCPGARKSMLFQLLDAPFTVQISDADVESVGMVVGPVHPRR